VRDLGRGAPLARRVAGVARFLASPQAPREHAHAQCDAALHCARKLQMTQGVLDVLDAAEERWDGRGLPRGLRGDQLPLGQRYLELARIGAGFAARSGLAAACEAVRRRSGAQLDPALAQRFLADAEALAGDLAATTSVWDPFLAAEPGLWLLDPRSLTPLFDAFALLADLKSGYFAGHSQGVARMAEAAARSAGLAEADAELLGRAALLHDLGRVAVPTGLWNKPGPLNAAEWERVHLHSYSTDRVLRRSPALRPYAEIAGRCHERLDGSGYHRGDTALERSVRLLAAADVYRACTEDRPWRPAHKPEAARRVLLEEAAAGKLCPQAVDAVLAAAGQAPGPRASDALSAREIEVMRLLVRGWSNKQIARELAISPRTVQHHTIHIYGKTGVKSRAGVALWAVEQRLF
jgi:HD-GYP domain-containing protein (c-di-GMP phosphodiesterase class II)